MEDVVRYFDGVSILFREVGPLTLSVDFTRLDDGEQFPDAASIVFRGVGLAPMIEVPVPVGIGLLGEIVIVATEIQVLMTQGVDIWENGGYNIEKGAQTTH